MEPAKRLTRSETDRMIAGVCGGLGRYTGIDPTLVRIAFVVLAFFGASGVIAYLVLWLIVPPASKADAPPRDLPREAVREAREDVTRGTKAVRERLGRWRRGAPDASDGPAGPMDAGDQPERGPKAEEPRDRGMP